MRNIKPSLIPRAADKCLARGVPLHRLSMIVRKVDQVADVGGARPGFNVADGWLATANGAEPVAQMISAPIELHFWLQHRGLNTEL